MGIFNSWGNRRHTDLLFFSNNWRSASFLDAAVNPAVLDNQVANTDPVKDAMANAGPATDHALAMATGVEAPPLPTKFDHLFNQDLNVVLVSSAIGDVQGVSAAVKENAEVIVFDSAQDDLASIKAKLDSLVNETGKKIDVLAVITHGSDGTIDIGQDHVTQSNFWAYQLSFQTLANDLTADAQLLFDSCDTAESGVGQSLVSSIAQATGADVFASSDATGGPGNNWVLEYSSDSAIHMTGILDPHVLSGLTLELGGQPGEPRDAWFHGTGVFQTWDIYNYSLGVYYTKDYKTYWDHKDSGAWQYWNTAAWVTTDNLGDAPYGDGLHYAAVNGWFTVPSGVGSYSGHQAYIASGVEYYQDDTGAAPRAILGPLRFQRFLVPLGRQRMENCDRFRGKSPETHGFILAMADMKVTTMRAECTTRRITIPTGTIRIPAPGNTGTPRPGSRPTTLEMRRMATAFTMRLSIRGSPCRQGLELIPAIRPI